MNTITSDVRPGYRWVVLSTCFTAFLISFVDRLTWASIALPASKALGLPIAALAIFATAFYVGYVASNVLGGLGVDRFGSRIVLSCSTVGLGIFTFFFGSITSITAGILIQCLMGLAAGADYSSCVKLVVVWFGQSERGKAMGLLLVATSLGVVVTNSIVPLIVEQIGWRGVYRLLGGLTIAIGVLTYILVRDRHTAVPQSSQERAGIGQIMSDRNMVLLALAGFGGFWGTWGFTFWANALMVRNYGLSPTEAGSVLSIVGIAAMIGKPLVGWISDRAGGKPRPIVIATLGLFAVMLMVFGTLSTVGQFMIAAPLLGIAAFVYSPLLAVVVAEVSGTRLAGSATGITSGLWQIGSVIVPVAVGIVFSATDSFVMAFGTLALGPALGCVCMALVRLPSHVGRDGAASTGILTPAIADGRQDERTAR